MDFHFTREEEAYRTQVRMWLERELATWQDRIEKASDDDARFEARRGWHRALHGAGYVGATWPREYGGQGLSAVENAILQEELTRAGAPPTANPLGIGLCGPAILHHGRDDQKERFLAPMLRADELWCQGYSEPGAGSDLAGLATRAETDGDHLVVNGQKIWTSMAQRADWCFALVRTDPTARRKHDGIGFLLIDMRTPGIDVRPIVQITAESEFCEVFFRDVRVPARNMVGSPTQGWRIANTVLGYERGANTLSMYATYRRRMQDLRNRRLALSGPKRAVMRDRLARVAIQVEVLRLNSLRQLTALARGEAPGTESSIQKLHWSELDQQVARLGVDLQGPYGQLFGRGPREPDGEPWTFHELNSRRFTIARGTSEIQRNIISERVLGLPRG